MTRKLPRNGAAVAAHARHAGPMKDKRSKRAEENKNPDFMEEYPADLDWNATCNCHHEKVFHGVDGCQFEPCDCLVFKKDEV